MTVLRTPAWLLRGISAIPGELVLARDRIGFAATGPGTAWSWQLRRLERRLGRPWRAAGDDPAVPAPHLFDWRLHRVRVRAPWYYFSGGIVLEHADCVLRFGFGPPVDAHARGAAKDGLLDPVRRMRRVGKRWLAALAQAQAVSGGAGGAEHAREPERRARGPG